ncbi:TPA: hypothetical protein DEP90_00275 [Patescibacteria group bacterium]|nr:hypothetical protein [Patescibacteria group bacterium]
MKENFKKVVVKSQDELIDIVRNISNIDGKKILVTFTEGSEILISSINLKVILDTVDEKKALLVLQILNNPTGIRNAKIAGITVIDTPTNPTKEVWLNAQTDYNARFSIDKKILPEKYKSANITSFEDRVNSVLRKNRKNRKKDGMVNTSTPGDTDIVIDQDINMTKDDQTEPEQRNLTKKDFKDIPDPIKQKPKKKFSLPKLSLPKLFKKKEKPSNKINPITGNLPQRKGIDKGDLKNKLIKLIPKLIIPLFSVLLLVAFLYYKFAPYVKVTIPIQSKPVEVEKIFTGNENINEIDFESLEIPIKTESATKSVSDTVDATGVAYRGDKATGSVTISYINPEGCTDADEAVSVYVGHQTETDGKKYLLTGDLTITCNSYGTVGVEAIEVGEEYNIPSGKYFSINGFDATKVYAVNSAAFTGGSKETYTVLSQADVNTKIEELTEIATEESVNSLDEASGEWKIIENTVKSKVTEGSINTAVAIGTETSSSDISLEVVSTATYYYTHGVDEGLNTLLTEAALNQNLFENSEGIALTLTGDIDKELTVEESEGDIKIKLIASSSVEPSVNKEAIVNDLKGMSWEDGNEYINSLSFTSGNPSIEFIPTSFPQKLRHFPSRQGRVDVKIEKDTVENE